VWALSTLNGTDRCCAHCVCVPHQANIRIMETVAKKLGIPMEKVLTNLDEYGNTSAGSIPLALSQAVREGKVKEGDVIAVAGFGAGLSWGSAVIRWGGKSL